MENKIYLLCIWNEEVTDLEEILSFHTLEAALERGWQIMVQWDEEGKYTLEEGDKDFWYEWQSLDGYMYIYETEFED